jgi:hypothetical protein
VIVFALAAAAAVAGSILVAQQPFFWGIVMGLLVTPVTLAMVLEYGIGLLTLFMMVVVVATWGALPSLSKVSGLLRNHPDLYAAHRILGTGLARGGRHRGRDLSREEQGEVLAASIRKSRVVSAVAALGTFALAVVPILRAQLQPSEAQVEAHAAVEAPPLEPVIEEFLEAWAGSDAAAVAGFFPPSHAEKMQTNVESIAATRGWGASFPQPRAWEATPISPTSAQVDLELAEGRLITRWLVDEEGRWVLAMIQPPRPGE